MKLHFYVLSALLGAVLTLPAFGEDHYSKINPTWHALIGKCDYTLAVNSIASVLLQQYVLQEDDKQFDVVELNIETVAGSNTRIFFSKEKGPQETSKSSAPVEVGGLKLSVEEIQKQAKAMAESGKIPGEPSSTDQKQPKDILLKKGSAGTYAKLLELQASSEAEVRNLHQSLLEKWLHQD